MYAYFIYSRSDRHAKGKTTIRIRNEKRKSKVKRPLTKTYPLKDTILLGKKRSDSSVKFKNTLGKAYINVILRIDER